MRSTTLLGPNVEVELKINHLLRTESKWGRRLRAGFSDQMRSFPYRVSGAPLTMTPDVYQAMADGVSSVHQILEKIIDLYVEDERLRDYFVAYRGFSDLIVDSARQASRILACRFDGAWDGTNFRLMETNTSCPGGLVHIPMGNLAWLSTDWAEKILSGRTLLPYPMLQDPFLFARTAVNRAQVAGFEPSRVALTSLRDAVGYDLDYVSEAFEALDVEAKILDVREVRGDELGWSQKASRFQLVYTKVSALNLLHEDNALAYVRALADQKAFAINPLAVQTITEDKSVLALMSDPDWAYLFSDTDRDVIARHIPWTRVVKEGVTTDANGLQVDLLEHLQNSQEKLVLKPASLFEGIGVMVGSSATPQQWRSTLTKAVRDQWIVQEYLPLPRVTVPALDGPEVLGAYADLSCFLIDGQLQGCSSRCSVNPVVNMGRGGVCRVPVLRIAND